MCHALRLSKVRACKWDVELREIEHWHKCSAAGDGRRGQMSEAEAGAENPEPRHAQKDEEQPS